MSILHIQFYFYITVYLLLIVLVEKRKTGEHLAAKVVSISLYYVLRAMYLWFSLRKF